MENSLHPSARRGIELFNAGEYFEAHEALEAAWRAEPGEIRNLYQGILQAAVCYFHLLRGNHAGALKMSARATRHLSPLPEIYGGVNVAALRRGLQTVSAALKALGAENIQQFDRSLLHPVRMETRFQ
ncbi:DUF309 domain-containing protein [bacterium]|nr:DUF309 domain-containing protein [bacterium]NCT21168.1 DUF309 domain-containing protein [bacterium]OIO86838.1 MAG: hypothetical protein AUK01_01765 [Anaerolineae bacterium CG2_30_57_67]